jgi:nucleoside-diphosphate-sugar epimerase
MKRIIITGGNGTIGTILRNGLQEVAVTSADLPDHDLRQLNSLTELFPGHDAIIHLAWSSERENYRTEEIDTENIEMAFNVLRAATQSGVPRVIIASSTQADDYRVGRDENLLSPYRLPTPKSPYGASKAMIEALGRYYAQKGLEVICIRFGGIRAVNRPRDPDTAKRFLTHKDCCSLVQSCIETPHVPGKYAIVYGISKNSGAIHDTSNPFGWQPEEDATLMISS